MSDELLSAAKAEEQRLLRQWQATPLFRRLEAVRAVLSAYEETPPEANQAPDGAVLSIRTRRTSSRGRSLTAQVEAVAAEYLRQQQRRAQSLEIHQVLNQRGVEIRGKKPTTVVASILSHSDLFDNVRGEGYGLVEWTAPSLPAPADQAAGERTDGGDEDDSGNDLSESADGQVGRKFGLDSRADLESNSSWATRASSWPNNGN